jgi:uncharacterized protein YPO0396
LITERIIVSLSQKQIDEIIKVQCTLANDTEQRLKYYLSKQFEAVNVRIDSTENKLMSAITDASAATTKAVSDLQASVATLTASVGNVGTYIQTLQTQLANDDTAGNDAAASALTAANAQLASISADVTSTANTLAGLVPTASQPVSGS